MTTPEERLDRHAREWNVRIERVHAGTSLIAYGMRADEPVVLKVIRREGSDEWRAGEVLDTFHGAGTVRALAHADGAVLMERVTPGTPLVDMVMEGRDEQATDIIADVVSRMAPGAVPNGVPAVEAWARSFDRYAASGDERISSSLIARAHRTYLDLCASQTSVRLLHGDLQHYNILLSGDRCWLAIDPKGVVGEVEYEAGAFLRNPHGWPELLSHRGAVQRRARRFASRLGLDAERVLAWAFSQAVLSAVWSVEDGYALDSNHAGMLLANTLDAVARN